MTILKEDTRGLTNVDPINFQSGEIVFYEMKINGSFAKSIEEMLKGNYFFIGEDVKKVDFNSTIKIFDLGGNNFILEYEDIKTRLKDINFFKLNFEKVGHFAKELEDGRQMPDFEGYFEYNGKYYSIINGLNKLTDEINPETGIYKGIIINPSEYFEKNQISELQKETVGKTDGILK